MIKIIDISDIHMGHPNISSHRLHKSFKTYLYPRLKDIDLLIISGDFFHNLITLNSDWAVIINTIINELRMLALNHEFIIRVMRGTFSHDNHQLKLFNNEFNQFKVENEPIKTIDTLELEHIESLDIWVMYKPDDLAIDNPMLEIKKLLKKHHIKQVDIFVNHGYFEHQVPKALTYQPHGTLKVSKLEPYVKGCILNGHIHTPSVNGKFINVGSYDRTCHGEEESKGYFYIEYNDNNITYEFIKNEEANIFRTCNLLRYDDDIAIEVFTKFLSRIPDTREKVYVRSLTNSAVLPTVLRDICTSHKLNIKYSNEKKELTQPVEDLVFTPIELPKLNETNIYGHLIKFIDDNYDVKLKEEMIKKVI